MPQVPGRAGNALFAGFAKFTAFVSFTVLDRLVKSQTLRSDRIELIPLTREDLRWFEEINTNSFVRKYLWDGNIMPTDIFRQILQEVEVRFTRDNWGLWKLKLLQSDTLIGYAGLWLFFDEHQPQLIYVLRPEYTGRGYADEAARLIIGHAFGQLNFKDLVATMDKENVASIIACERLGFEFIEERIAGEKPILFYRLRSPEQLS